MVRDTSQGQGTVTPMRSKPQARPNTTARGLLLAASLSLVTIASTTPLFTATSAAATTPLTVTQSAQGDFTIRTTGGQLDSATITLGTPSKKVALTLIGATIKVDDSAFSGTFSLPITLVTKAGEQTTSNVTLTVPPKAPTGLAHTMSIFAEITPDGGFIETFSTRITWVPSPNAVGYELIIEGGEPTTVGRVSSVSVKGTLGQNSTIELRALGNDGTKSAPATRSADADSLTIFYSKTAVAIPTKAKADLDLLVAAIKSLSPTTVNISAGAGARANIGTSRAAIVKAYLAQQLRAAGFKTSAFQIDKKNASAKANTVIVSYKK